MIFRISSGWSTWGFSDIPFCAGLSMKLLQRLSWCATKKLTILLSSVLLELHMHALSSISWLCDRIFRCWHLCFKNFAGKSLTPAQKEWEFILAEPNSWRFITTMFRDPQRMVEYMSDQCATDVVPSPVSLLYLTFMPSPPPPSQDIPDVVACADTFGGSQAYFMCAPYLLVCLHPGHGIQSCVCNLR